MLVGTRPDRADDPPLDAAQRQVTLRKIVDHRLVAPGSDSARDRALAREQFQERGPAPASPRTLRTQGQLMASKVGGVTRINPPFTCDTTTSVPLSRGARTPPVV